MTKLDLGIDGLSDYRQIGAGGFATVYSAFEVEANRLVAVKILTAVDERGRRYFERERRTMGQTTAHDNIVTMFRSGYTATDGRPYLVMECMSGGSLQDRLDTHGPLPVKEAVDLLVPPSRGLAYAHATNILHRDIKPANILISATGVPKLSDFGIAAIRDATASSQLAFSLAFTPPETFSAERAPDGSILDPRDERSDLYSLGVTLYALITGKPPFLASSQAAMIHLILTQAPHPLGDQWLDSFFAVALAKHPSSRFQNAKDFIDALAVDNNLIRSGSNIEKIRQTITLAPDPHIAAGHASIASADSVLLGGSDPGPNAPSVLAPGPVKTFTPPYSSTASERATINVPDRLVDQSRRGVPAPDLSTAAPATQATGPRYKIAFAAVVLLVATLGAAALAAWREGGSASENEATRDSGGNVVDSGSLSAFKIKVGDCVGSARGEIESLTAMPCSSPHQNEVYYSFTLPDGAYPGKSAVQGHADEGCLGAFEGFVGVEFSASIYQISTLTPTNVSWDEAQDREILCLIGQAEGTLTTGSAKGTAR